jgi:hypothetical protein
MNPMQPTRRPDSNGVPVNVCDTCLTMLYDHEGDDWEGTFDLIFRHQKSWQDFESLENEPCCICNTILERIKSDANLSEKASTHAIDPSLLRAGLSAIRDPSSPEKTLYRLAFKLEEHNLVGDFILEPRSCGLSSLLCTHP